MFSKSCEYGIRAVIFIAGQPKRMRLQEIAAEIGAPEAFTGKILQQLARHDIIQALKGPSGGYEMNARGTGALKLSQIVDAIDGNAIYQGCGLGLPGCDARRPCPLHHKFERIRENLRVMLEQTTVAELAAGPEHGLTFLKR